MKRLIFSFIALLSVTLSFAQTNRTKSEVFVQIADRGTFTVYIDNESVTSSTGRFRFFDVYTASPTLYIVQNKITLLSRKIDLTGGGRVILDYSRQNSLRNWKIMDLYRNREYAPGEWDEYPRAYNSGVVPPVNVNYEMGKEAFATLLRMVNGEYVYSGKLKIITAAVNTPVLSVAQVKSLSAGIYNESEKLEFIKLLYPRCMEKQNYYTLAELFYNPTNKDALLDFIIPK